MSSGHLLVWVTLEQVRLMLITDLCVKSLSERFCSEYDHVEWTSHSMYPCEPVCSSQQHLPTIPGCKGGYMSMCDHVERRGHDMY
jgi:hypothetical protein